jgi:hypothetical protein
MTAVRANIHLFEVRESVGLNRVFLKIGVRDEYSKGKVTETNGDQEGCRLG